MPPVSEYVLKGGPCDGKTGQLTGAIADSGQLTCQNHIYKVVTPIQIVSGREVFQDAGPVPVSKPQPVEPHAHTAWHDLQRSVNNRWPGAVRAASAQRQAALRSLARASRVRV